MSATTTQVASEGGHWYGRDEQGRAAQITQVIGKNGKARRPTLRDARRPENGWVPGITTILKAAGQPHQLVRWRINQAVLAALTLPREPGETEASWLERLEVDMNATAAAAADRGTEIHAALEAQFDLRLGDVPPEHVGRVVAASQELANAGFHSQVWQAERAVINRLGDMGYGSKSDLHSAAVCVDWKTKDGPDMPGYLYDEHICQLAATRAALEYTCGYPVGSQRCGIVYVSRTHDVARWVEATEEQLGQGLKLFRHLLGYWYDLKKHKPNPALWRGDS